ncbi:hypothetical protein [Helicovermis profundi]|uniref:Uncharacterized protein n=1 Tax=Helicovermis profundi TaxID=3065157 RepID=A0AAU9EAA2_9FIRM|nr:hypothetical protein HLPR_11130 [Clostridia bacterium S502]
MEKKKKKSSREVKRKVLFYYMSSRLVDDKKTRIKGKGVKALIVNTFNENVKNNIEDGMKIKSKAIEHNEGDIVVDLLNIDDNYVFIRMAKEKDINSYQKRNKKNLKSEKITLEVDQYIEVYSFFILDLNKMIISLIYSQGAPGMKWFSELISDTTIKRNSNNRKYKVNTEISPIPNDNILYVINKMNFFTSFEMSFAIPSKDIFEEVTGKKVQRKMFKKMAEIDSKSVTIKISGGDDKLSNNYKEIKELAELVYDSRNDEITDIDGRRKVISKCKVTGRFGDGERQSLDLFDEMFTWQITLKHDSGKTYIPIEIIKRNLIIIYENLEDDLSNRIEISNLNF